jgi:hydrogenase nickel incorporation protein HypA/HybF
MHELSIALSIVDGVLEEAERHGAGKVEAVHLRLGRMSGVDKDALLFSYGIACQDTPLRDSRLVIEDIEVAMHCPVCRAERPAQSFPLLVCAECGSPGERMIHGEEMEISALELAT